MVDPFVKPAITVDLHNGRPQYTAPTAGFRFRRGQPVVDPFGKPAITVDLHNGRPQYTAPTAGLHLHP